MFRHAIKNLATIAASLGVRRAVIAPGSRNTPLTLALTANPDISCYPVTDERSAGFFALGIAQYSRQPVVLVCTSGSAVLNFAPAVAEAYYQNLPLIVVTADRPVEWIDQSDGQTIRQQNIYANYCKASFQLPTESDAVDASFQLPAEGDKTDASFQLPAEGDKSDASFQLPAGKDANDASFSDRLVAQAIDMALQFPRGPVHLNVPLNEPLYIEMPDDVPPPRILRTLTTETLPSEETAQLFLESWSKATRRMIVVGTDKGDSALNLLLNSLSTQTDTLVVAENLSNIRGAAIVSTPDLFFSSLTDDEKKALQPDLLITIGHSVVSKQLKTFLRAHQPTEHWQLQTELPYADTYRSLTHILPVKGETMLKLIAVSKLATSSPVNDKNAVVNSVESLTNSAKNPVVNSPTVPELSSYRRLITSVFDRVRLRANAYIDQLPPCDIALFRDLLPVIPSGWVVQLANSTPVRISQFFESRPDLQYFCNRGTSGIDGSVATAAGSALASGLPTLLITGDLSFIYDSNGLWNAHFPPNLKIIVLNNDGANIFSMIGDQKVIERCQPFFDARHSVNIEALCRAFGIDYKKLEWHHPANNDAHYGVNALPDQQDGTINRNAGQLTQAARVGVADFLHQAGAAVLEVTTDRSVNVFTYKDLFKALH